jgi:beta-lactamase superfamily II metal-dependent hydrolase
MGVGYEIDFLPVGEGEKSGDAIALRFGNLFGERQEQFVMVIDGGTQDSGKQLVEHIKKYYKTDRVDLVVSTHPDSDHASGLTVVLNGLKIDRLWMHKPWEHASNIRSLFQSGRITDTSLRETLRGALENANELERIARQKGIPIDEPFAGEVLPFANIGVQVLGPSRTFYESLLPFFRETPQPRQTGIFERAVTAVLEAVKWIAEIWPIETLTDPAVDASSAENNTSVILLFRIDDHLILLTADAGVPALEQAAAYAESAGVDLTRCRLIQVPHHGSRRNVGPTILDRILGPKFQRPGNDKTAYVSAAKDGAPKHPSRKVANAFQRRGAKERVFATQGGAKCHPHNAPDRGWSTATPLPFYEQVEE